MFRARVWGLGFGVAFRVRDGGLGVGFSGLGVRVPYWIFMQNKQPPYVNLVNP